MTEENKTFDERQIVIFSLGKEEFGVNINEVKEIIRIEQITKIPNTEQYIKGVINLRGGIIVVIDLAMKLGFPTKEVDKNTRILVVEVGKNTVGMIVDSATEVMRLSGDEVQPAPQIITEKIDADYIEGVGIIGERLLILLDLARVLEGKALQHIQQIQEAPPEVEESAPEVKPVEESVTPAAPAEPVAEAPATAPAEPVAADPATAPAEPVAEAPAEDVDAAMAEAQAEDKERTEHQ